jgi:3-hydroxybutyryl-CoA dehydratase
MVGISQQTALDLDPWELTHDWVQEYLTAVGDSSPVYRETGLAPPLALAARTLGQLLDKLSLPAGAIHSLQELETLGPARPGQQVRGLASLERPRRQGSLEFRTVAYQLRDGGGRPLLRGKSTVLIVQSAGQAAGQAAADQSDSRTQLDGAARWGSTPPVAATGAARDLPVVCRTITQAQLDAYSQVSGDRNPLHWDARFAAGTQFGGVIAHGMLTLALISEMLAGAFGRAWLEGGKLEVRFKGAARPGDRVKTWGRVTKEEPLPQGRRVECLVGLRHASTLAELISGSASVVLPSGVR